MVVSNSVYIHWYLGKWSNLTNICFRWDKTTTFFRWVFSCLSSFRFGDGHCGAFVHHSWRGCGPAGIGMDLGGLWHGPLEQMWSKSRKSVRDLNEKMCGLCIVCIQTYLAVSIRIPTFSVYCSPYCMVYRSVSMVDLFGWDPPKTRLATLPKNFQH